MANKFFSLSFLLYIILSLDSFSQYAKFSKVGEPNNDIVQEIINKVNIDSLMLYVKELSGEVPTYINGVFDSITSRNVYHIDNRKAEIYLEQKFRSFGLQTKFQPFMYAQNRSDSVRNIIALLPGYKYPNQKFVITAHMDCSTDYPIMEDRYVKPAPGADDNASGTAAILEAARIFSKYKFPFSIVFLLYNSEEYGSPNGTGEIYFHRQSKINNDSLVGLIELDMIGYDGYNDNNSVLSYSTCLNAEVIAKRMIDINNQYNISLVIMSDETACSVNVFSEFGHIFFYEDILKDISPGYHNITDRINLFNPGFFEKCTKLSLATLAKLALNDPTGQMEAPSLRKPENGDNSTSVNPVLKWNYNENAMNYDLQISNNITFSSLVFDTTGINGLSSQRYNLPKNTLYYWRVRGSNYAGKSPWAEIRSFTTEKISAPTITSPGGTYYFNKSINQIFKWKSVLNAISYHLQVALDKNFTTFACNDSTITTLQKTANFLQYHKKYYFRMRAKDNEGNVSRWTDLDSLTTQINIPNPIYPPHFSTNISLNTIFKWSSSIGKVKYQLQIAKKSSFDDSSLVVNEICFDTTKQIMNLKSKTQYYWGVKALSLEYPSECYSTLSVYNFTTDVEILPKKIISKYFLYQNYPNPFNPNTTIKFEIPHSGLTTLKIYSILGEEVASLISNKLDAGAYSIEWDAKSFPSGIYFYQLISRDFRDVKKFILLK